jgi:hypothetical protein
MGWVRAEEEEGFVGSREGCREGRVEQAELEEERLVGE